MFKKMSLLIIVMVFSTVIIMAQATGESPTEGLNLPSSNYIENEKLRSSMFTREADERLLDPETFIAITADDDLISENDAFRLYLNPETLNFKIENKHTNYVWSTAVEDPEAGTYTGLLSSGLGIEYVNKQQNMAYRANIGLTATAHNLTITPITNGVRVDIDIEEFCSTRNCANNYDMYLDGRLTLEQMINMGLVLLNTQLTLEVELTDTGIKAHIPYESIEEAETDWTVLTSLILFPGLGATVLDEVPGYMMMPDGIGTLIRYEDNEGKYSTPYEERFYGSNAGLRSFRQSVSNYPLSLPMFGAVHGVNQNAYIGMIESGDVNARLLAFPNGAANIDYNLMFTKFDYRQIYRQSFTSDGSGGATRVAETMRSDVTVHYDFLADEKANYVGLASHYRDHLIASGVLKPESLDSGDIPIHTQYLMSDSLNRFIGTRLIEMSSVDDVFTMYDTLMARGLDRQVVTLMGWNNGGYSGHLPSGLRYETSLGRSRDFRDLISYINADNQVYLLNNFVQATNATARISYRNDVAQGVDRFQLERRCTSCVYQRQFTLYPESTEKLALRHADGFIDSGAHILFERLGSRLFSYYDSTIYMREDALNHYQTVMETYQGHGAYVYPNAYALPYTNQYFHAPIFNSQLNYFDDLVPIIPIVLSGHMDVYSQFLNYNALGQEQLLMLIDFGMNPAFVLSQARSSDLRGTDIEQYFSTRFDNWEDNLVETYHYMNDALKHVRGSSIVSRDVLQTGVVNVTYSNGVHITLNYTSQPVMVDDVFIDPYDYVVRGDDS